MTESEEHKKLKAIGKTLLLQRGFEPEFILTEYKVEILDVLGKKSNKTYIVDVCGLPKKRADSNHIVFLELPTIAIECGNTSGHKLNNLKMIFDEVIHLPYGVEYLLEDVLVDTINKYDEEVYQLKRQIKTLEEELTSYRLKQRSEERNTIYLKRIFLLLDIIKRLIHKDHPNPKVDGYFDHDRIIMEPVLQSLLEVLPVEEEYYQNKVDQYFGKYY